VDGAYHFRIEESPRGKYHPDIHYAIGKMDTGQENRIPLWLFGFLY
jgi:hypothetical protein